MQRAMHYARPQLRIAAPLPPHGPNAEELYELWLDAQPTRRDSRLVFRYQSPERAWAGRLCSIECIALRCGKRSNRTLPYCKQHLAEIYRLALGRTRLRNRRGKRHSFYGIFAVGSPAEVVFRVGQDIVPYLGEQFTDPETLYERYGSRTAIYGFANHRSGVFTDSALVRGAAASINQANRSSENNAHFRESSPYDMITAARDIYGGEEILVSYGDAYELDEAFVRYSTSPLRKEPRRKNPARQPVFVPPKPVW